LTVEGAAVEEHRFRSEPALTLRAGDLTATFLPGLGMTGVSLRYHGREHLALPGGLGALRAGRTLGLPLLAPWANRLASRRYRAAGVRVDLRGLRLGTDDHGLPIHGLLVGRGAWRVDATTARAGSAGLRASVAVDAPAFPFPHTIALAVRVRDGALRVDTTITPTGHRSVPVAFGWHPYLRLPGTPRSRWRLELPPRHHLTLDRFGIPTGESTPEPSTAAPIKRRTFDDLYALGRARRLELVAEDGSRVALECGANYPFAQVWVPPGRPFAALEPMAAATNALGGGRAPLVAPGEQLTARFTLVVTGQTR
jgi:aldose 1-epimerase